MRVLFLDLDTLRPDHLGCYGYHRNTSPNIDSIAEKAVRFNNYYCSDAPCLPSRASLMSGRFGIHNGAVGHGGTAADMMHDGSPRDFRDRMNDEALPKIFRKAGMKTASISPFAERHSSYWFYSGFNETHNTGNGGMESAEEVTPVVLKWIEDNASDDNWFLHINYWDAHTPYRAPEEFGNPFKDDPLPEWLTEEALEDHKKAVGPHGCYEVSMFNNNTDPKYPRHPGEVLDMDAMRTMIDGYDCGIRYMDSHIGQLIEAFKAKGVYDDLVIIISADHGENIGELGLYGEHATADYPTCRIPMILRWPGCKEGHVDDGFHYNLDLSPTLAEMLDIEPCDGWDGRSYASTLKEGEDVGRDYLVLSQCAHVCQRSVRYGDYIYIRTYHDGYHISFNDEMLFNVAEDPHQTKNLVDERPDICGICARLLDKWHSEMMKSSTSQIDPLWTVYHEGGPYHARGHFKEYCDFLEKSDRAWAIPELKKRHPRDY